MRIIREPDAGGLEVIIGPLQGVDAGQYLQGLFYLRGIDIKGNQGIPHRGLIIESDPQGDGPECVADGDPARFTRLDRIADHPVADHPNRHRGGRVVRIRVMPVDIPGNGIGNQVPQVAFILPDLEGEGGMGDNLTEGKPFRYQKFLVYTGLKGIDHTGNPGIALDGIIDIDTAIPLQ